MQIKIGIIGNGTVVHTMLRVIRNFPTFEPVVRIAEHESDAPQIAQELAPHVEVLLFFSAESHRKAKEKLSANVPMHVVPLTGTSLYKALFRTARAGLLHGGVSVDSLTKTMVMRTLKDLGIADTRVMVYEGPAYASPDKLVQFHLKQSSEAGCTIAFTGVESAARELDRQGFAMEWLIPSEQDMIVTLERALLSTESRRGKESQIVVGIINVDNFGKLVMTRTNEHEVQRLKLDIHRMVLGYVESLDGYLTSLGGDEYLFFTTRGIFERETGGYKTIPLAKDANTSHGIALSLGIGFGLSANEAGTNARSALRKAKEAGGNACFIVREDQTLIGPLEMSDPLQTVMSPTDPELIKLAADAGMTSAYLSKLLAHMARYGKYEYKVHELAALLEVTVRTAHRLLLLWMDNGLVEVAGMEKVPKGRPRQIFRFPFLTRVGS